MRAAAEGRLARPPDPQLVVGQQQLGETGWVRIEQRGAQVCDEVVEPVTEEVRRGRRRRQRLRDQIVEYRSFFVTEATKGKRFGWQSEEDWNGTIAILEKVKSIPAGSKPSDYYTNKFVPG